MNFYFSILSKSKRKILDNQSHSLLFENLLNSKQSLSLVNYSGYAFETFVSRLLRKDQNRNEAIFKSLDVKNCDYELGNFRNDSDQIDIILKACSDRMDRLIECRWTHDTSSILQLINDLSKKMPFVERSKKYIISNCPLTDKVKKTAQAHRIKMIPLSDLF
ncbi:MAG: hypothetical protein IPK04_09070 [Bdellovibrionales bacterium]|nr:hypothetical protein [Bdellovibrionales bacterium]